MWFITYVAPFASHAPHESRMGIVCEVGAAWTCTNKRGSCKECTRDAVECCFVWHELANYCCYLVMDKLSTVHGGAQQSRHAFGLHLFMSLCTVLHIVHQCYGHWLDRLVRFIRQHDMMFTCTSTSDPGFKLLDVLCIQQVGVFYTLCLGHCSGVAPTHSQLLMFTNYIQCNGTCAVGYNTIHVSSISAFLCSCFPPLASHPKTPPHNPSTSLPPYLCK
jgi:hypothetical protein